MLITNHTKSCWIAGAVLGAFIWAFVTGPGPLDWAEGLFMGLVSAGLTGAFLNWLICGGGMGETGDRDFQSLISANNAGALDAVEENIVASLVPGGEDQRVIAPSGDAQVQARTIQGGPF